MQIPRNKKLFDPTAGATSAVTLYTAGASTKCRINKLTIYNGNATTDRIVTVYLVPSGGTAGATNLLAKHTIGFGETWTVVEAIGHILDAGDFLAFVQDTGTDTLAQGSGTEYTT